MNTAAETLPDDVTALRLMLLEARAERDAERDQNTRLAAQVDRLRHLLRQLQRLQFGRRSEKLDPDQLNLAFEDLEQAVAEVEAEQEKADPALKRARAVKRRTERGSLPEHLPRVELVIEPDDTACPCCGGAMHEVVLIAGTTVTVKVAHVRLCHSRMLFVRAYPRETQEMVFDAHNRAFAFFKGACTRGIYDNMKTAVDAVFLGKDRQYNRRFQRMCGHFPSRSPAHRRRAGRRDRSRTRWVGARAFLYAAAASGQLRPAEWAAARPLHRLRAGPQVLIPGMSLGHSEIMSLAVPT